MEKTKEQERIEMIETYLADSYDREKEDKFLREIEKNEYCDKHKIMIE